LKKFKAHFAVGFAALALSVAVAACGDSDSGEETASTEASAAELAPVKQYLTDHSADLVEQVGTAPGERRRVLRAGQVGRLRLPAPARRAR
jgi:hypothetical protein